MVHHLRAQNGLARAGPQLANQQGSQDVLAQPAIVDLLRALHPVGAGAGGRVEIDVVDLLLHFALRQDVEQAGTASQPVPPGSPEAQSG